MTKHRCKPHEATCCCYQLADEPSWDCPIHGGGIINRCECGRFVRPTSYGVSQAEDAVDPSEDSNTGNPSTRV